jgi:hypothetical protein
MKTIRIEWRRLVRGGETCERCHATGETLSRLVTEMNRECEPKGCRFVLEETGLEADSLPESNSLLIDGIRLEQALPGARVASSDCESCCELIGERVECRTVELGGFSYEALPEQLMRDAICRVAGCC